MPDYRRWYVPGATYFFTVVTHQRQPILTTDIGRRCLRLAMRREQHVRPFDQFAVVLLPDHLHAIWILPEGDDRFSTRWRRIKSEFTKEWFACGGDDGETSRSRQRHGERAIWQRRFWEHLCRDADDLKRFLDYLHWNPVKHGLVTRVQDWRWSSFRKFVEMEEYDLNWGNVDPCPDFDEPEWE